MLWVINMVISCVKESHVYLFVIIIQSHAPTYTSPPHHHHSIQASNHAGTTDHSSGCLSWMVWEQVNRVLPQPQIFRYHEKPFQVEINVNFPSNQRLGLHCTHVLVCNGIQWHSAIFPLRYRCPVSTTYMYLRHSHTNRWQDILRSDWKQSYAYLLLFAISS